eukprot:13371554-Alexandrium_andersonii.AAC.1
MRALPLSVSRCPAPWSATLGRGPLGLWARPWHARARRVPHDGYPRDCSGWWPGDPLAVRLSLSLSRRSFLQ